MDVIVSEISLCIVVFHFLPLAFALAACCDIIANDASSERALGSGARPRATQAATFHRVLL